MPAKTPNLLQPSKGLPLKPSITAEATLKGSLLTPRNGLQSAISRHQVLNTAESAAFLNFSIPHFRRLYRTGVVPAPIQLSTRKLGWRIGDLIDWVGSRQPRPVASEEVCND